jgi:hypothetical protein
LWRAVAEGVNEPAAVARFADLLWCRRDGPAGMQASRAARSYLQLAGTGDIDIDGMEFLLGAWTLGRRIGDADVVQQARARLAKIAEDVITHHPGDRPGILLPALEILTRGAARGRKAVQALPD